MDAYHGMKRPALWGLCRNRKLPCYSANAECIKSLQEADRKLPVVNDLPAVEPDAQQGKETQVEPEVSDEEAALSAESPSKARAKGEPRADVGPQQSPDQNDAPRSPSDPVDPGEDDPACPSKKRKTSYIREIEREKSQITVITNITGYGIDLHQTEIERDGNSLWRAFAVAHGMGAARWTDVEVDARLRWREVVGQDNRGLPESRRRLQLYRAMNEESLGKPFVQTLAAWHTDGSPPSPTILCKRDNTNLRGQIMEANPMWGDLYAVQVIADAEDVEIVVHFPGHDEKDDFAQWLSCSRGRHGALLVHLIYYPKLRHWNAAEVKVRAVHFMDHPDRPEEMP